MVCIHGIWSSRLVWLQGGFNQAVQQITGTRVVGLADYHTSNSKSFDPRRTDIEGVDALRDETPRSC